MVHDLVDQRLQIGVVLFELAAFALALALNRFSNRLDLLTARQAVIIAVPLLLSVASAGYVARQLIRARGTAGRRLGFALAANLVGVALALTLAEAAVRALAVDTSTGRSFAGTILLPKAWDEVRVRASEILAHTPVNVSYLVPDETLGWVPGSSRRDRSGIYATSVEGIRSDRPGVSYSKVDAGRRVALVGDSYTFGLEVPFDQSWGNRLNRSLGSDTVVLNFGVDGYGVDQAYLRYKRDVRRWTPQVSVMGFIDHDLYRSLGVYTFITFPEWGFPFSKPRFTLEDERLVLLNVPLDPPTELFARPSVMDLPFLSREPGYVADEWRRRAYDSSYLLRFLFSRFRPSARPEVEDEWNEEIAQLNTALLLQFISDAAADGTSPMIVYFPSRGDFSGQDRSGKDRVLANLRHAGVDVVDMTSCIAARGEEAFIPGRPHYSSAGNSAVADCLLPLVKERLEAD